MKISYLLPPCGIGGGPRVVLMHLNYLRSKGHDAQLFIIGKAPDWFQCDFPVNVCDSYEDACSQMSRIGGIKVATFWETAPYIQRACEDKGEAVFLVQDVETGYVEGQAEATRRVLETYHLPWRLILTDSPWTEGKLLELGVTSPIKVLRPPVDLDVFRRMPDIERDPDRILYIGRGEPMKGLALMEAAMSILESWQVPVKVCMFGIEPKIRVPLQETYLELPSDEEIVKLYNSSFCLVLSSKHEGYGLPIVEAMACGTPVITTLADGNNHFCNDGTNCLTVTQEPLDLAIAIYWLHKRKYLQEFLAWWGLQAAEDHKMAIIGDSLEQTFGRLVG